MNKLYLVGLTLIATMLMALPSTTQANLVYNPGFESGSGTAADGWIQSGATQREGWAAHSGSYGMVLASWWDGGSGQGTGKVYQDISATGGFPYTYDIWAQLDGAGGYSGTFYVDLEWFNGATSLGTNSQNITLTSSWAQYILAATAPASADTVRLGFGSIGVNPSGKFDDVGLTVVPEPTSLLLLGSGLIGLLALRKRTIK